MSKKPTTKPVNDLISFWSTQQKEKTTEQISSQKYSEQLPSRSWINNNSHSNSSLTNISPSVSIDSSLSIVGIKTIQNQNDRGRMDWDSLPQNTTMNMVSRKKSIPPKDISFLNKPFNPKPIQHTSMPRDKKVSNLVSRFENSDPESYNILASSIITPTDPLNISSSSPIKTVKKDRSIPSPLLITTSVPLKQTSPIQQKISETTHKSPANEIPVKIDINDILLDTEPVSQTKSSFINNLPESSLEKKLPDLPKDDTQSPSIISQTTVFSHRRKTIPIQSKRDSISPIRKKVPIYTTKNENEGSNLFTSQTLPLNFDVLELDPLQKVQHSSNYKESTLASSLKRGLSDPTSNNYTLPTINISLANDTNPWKFQGESPPLSSNSFNLNSSELTENDFNSNLNQQFDAKIGEKKTNNPFLYKVVGQKSGNKKKTLPSIQDSSTYIMEMQETHTMNSNKSPDKSNQLELPIKSSNTLRKLLSTSYSSSKKSKSTNKLPNTLTVTLRDSGNFHTYASSDDLRSVSTGRTKQKTLKPVQIPKSPYNSVRPQRTTLSPISTLKKNPFLKHIKTKRSEDHNLPEYTSSKSKMSFMVPHSLASVEYKKNNRSVPDLTARTRHSKFNRAFRKNNVTVPDFTRVNAVTKDSIGKKDANVNNVDFKNDTDLNPSKVTKFSINIFDKSESSDLFKPGAPWIQLSHLDEYIKSLPPTEFSDPKDLMTKEEYEKFVKECKSVKHSELIFPPMHQIPDGISLEDLENNMLKKPSTFLGIQMTQGRRNDWLDAAIDGVLAVEGVIGIQTSPDKLTKFEIIRDFIQFLTLVLSFGNPGIFQSWVKILLDTIPNLLSLNLDRVFGNGIAFFLVFCVTAFGALYWFRMMTKWDPNADAEGLESSPWNLRPETKRRQNIIITFLLTTLYLPISKLSIDALVWGDTFWAIPNPYIYSDTPEFSYYNNMTDNRNPNDFCYVTSMREGDLNFSPVIIGVALVTLVLLTFWFPFALKKLVDKNAPKVDEYNEVGESVADVDGEYRKLLEKDTCPYNFLYNAYNEKWVAYKSFIMANKFFNILLVSLISKDNCIFRNTPRTRIESIRQGIQIVLMVLLFFIHWRNEPYLIATQNASEYWTRSGYVITVILGMIVVLKIGPYQGISISIIVINCIIGIAVVWYILKETQPYQNFVKIIKKRLDFSINIYSPNLDFQKHIKRRIWQETWTTLFLTSERFKMEKDKIVAYSQSPYRPPYLLNFMGSVAERHVENLKIIRHIGIRRYTASLSPLPSSLVSLRTKILNNYVGPDMYYAPEFLNIKIKTCFGKAYVVPFPFSVVMCYDEDESVVVLTQEWEIQRYVDQNENKEVRRRKLVRQMIRALEGKVVIGPCRNKGDKNNNFEGYNKVQKKFFGASSNSEVHYHRGLLQIRCNQLSTWNSHNMNSGFEVTITYTNEFNSSPDHERTVGHDIIGITHDFQMTPQLERLFTDNYEIVSKGLDQIQSIMQKYRKYYRDEAIQKEETLSYGFFINIYDNPSIPLETLPTLLMTTETNPKVQEIPVTDYSTLIYLYERMRIVNLSRAHQWWYLFWEDLWRKNNQEIEELRKYAQDFSPAYRTSLCYRPMTRLELEKFLKNRGIWKNDGRNGFLHSGVLNRIYLYLNNVVFARQSSSKRKIGEVEVVPRKWRITRGKIIDDYHEYNTLLGKIRRSVKERVFMTNYLIRRKTKLSRTRSFFVLNESDSEEDSNNEI
ncbi:482_t:CDS:2 [Dentiscutata heterogama]|uniref:482_t:CDS:1 n=1 Tax=Dentiscutata heterogama TaxID=1316150 RepID=A0ACA9KB26_9GLOM|nr:482_t:CDS:2 [Dentiscutata heterogama]